MKVIEAAFIGYPVRNIAQARAFYEDVLGLSIGEIDEQFEDGKFWVEYDLGNTTLAISDAWEPSGQSGPTLALEVEDFDSALNELKSAGVSIALERYDTPVCCFAIITDPDGNSITIHKRR